MGCEICSKENRNNNDDVSLTRRESIKKIIKEGGNNNFSYEQASNYSSLEERLNQKYSIPYKCSIENSERNNSKNKNIFNYTQNIVNNNIIQISSRNNINLDREKDLMSLISNRSKINDKEEFLTSIYSNYNLKSELESNKLISDRKQLSEESSINNNKKIKKNNEHDNKDNSISSKEKENNINNKKHKNKKKEIKEKEENRSDKNNEIHNKNDNDKIIENTISLDLKQMNKKIISLLEKINHSIIDNILENAPKRENTSLEKLIKYLKKKSKNLSDVEKAWLVFKWIALNIEYDFAGVNNHNYDVSNEATFNRGKSICEGYSRLYKNIGEKLGLIVEFISGYAKGFNYEITDKLEESESHAWNTVKIDDKWFFVESTWGAGYSEDHHNFIKRFNDYYFFTPPIQFVRGHFPNESKWQLLPKDQIVDQKKFMEFVQLKSHFYKYGFKSIDPDYTFNHVSEKGNFKIFFDKKEEKKLKMMASLKYYKNNDNLEEIKNSILVVKKENYYELNYLLNKKGKYKLEIFGGIDDSKKCDELCSLILISKTNSSKLLTYPEVFASYSNSDMQIIQPLEGTLYNGDKLTFEYNTKYFSKLYIGIKNENGNNFTEMEKDGDIFKEKDVLIYGQKIMISTKNENENNYNSIIEYNVELNPNKNEITFPETFAGPKNKLIEPIKQSLKKGKNITFKIQSNIIKEMGVFDGDDFHELEKKEDIFTGTLQISGKGEVAIAYKKNKKEVGILYKYKVC